MLDYFQKSSNCDVYNSRKDHRVEIRKTIGGTQLLIVVHDDWKVDLSANGKLVFDTGSWLDLKNAVDEAKIVLL